MDKCSPLTSVSATREVLQAHGLATKKALGQHFLINDGIVSRICELSGVTSRDVVLEVGPGIGTLTLALLKKARQVIAVERDPDLPRVLADTCADHTESFALISKDALELTENDVLDAVKGLSSVGAVTIDDLPTLFIANLPYAVAATIILDFFEQFEFLQSATVMVQREVADRICAEPGTKAYGAYTVKLALLTQVKGRFTVGPQNFFPPPRVDSAVVRLDRRSVIDSDTNNKSADAATLKAAALMAEAAFANRRKTILNSSRTYFTARGAEGEEMLPLLPELFAAAGIDVKTRGETLSAEQYLHLGSALLKLQGGL